MCRSGGALSRPRLVSLICELTWQRSLSFAGEKDRPSEGGHRRPGALTVTLVITDSDVQPTASSISTTIPALPSSSRPPAASSIRRREADLADIPLRSELGESDEQRQILDVLSGDVTVGRPILTAPDV